MGDVVEILHQWHNRRDNKPALIFSKCIWTVGGGTNISITLLSVSTDGEEGTICNNIFDTCLL
jgi:hypothetical protein